MKELMSQDYFCVPKELGAAFTGGSRISEGIKCSYNNSRNALLPLFLPRAEYRKMSEATQLVKKECSIPFYTEMSQINTFWLEFFGAKPLTLYRIFIPNTEEVYIVGKGIIFSQHLEPLVYMGLPHRYAKDYLQGFFMNTGKLRVVVSQDALTSQYPYLKASLEKGFKPLWKKQKCKVKVQAKVPIDISVFKVTELKTFPFTTDKEMQTQIKRVLTSNAFQKKYCK